MSKEEFKRLYQGDFKVDEGWAALLNRLSKYYRDTEKIENRDAAPLWIDFKGWCEKKRLRQCRN